MYPISYKGDSVGTVTLCKEGMFWKIACNCRLPNKGIYRVIVLAGKKQYSLGICVPDGDRHICVGRIACNKLSGDQLSFAVERNDKRIGIKIETGQTFAYLDKLKAARLHIVNGQPEIIIDSVQDQQDSGRSPLHQNIWALK